MFVLIFSSCQCQLCCSLASGAIQSLVVVHSTTKFAQFTMGLIRLVGDWRCHWSSIRKNSSQQASSFPNIERKREVLKNTTGEKKIFCTLYTKLSHTRTYTHKCIHLQSRSSISSSVPKMENDKGKCKERARHERRKATCSIFEFFQCSQDRK